MYVWYQHVTTLMLLQLLLQSGLGLPTPPKGTIITLASAMDSQQVNPLYYKQTDETAKFEQVGFGHKSCLIFRQTAAQHG